MLGTGRTIEYWKYFWLFTDPPESCKYPYPERSTLLGEVPLPLPACVCQERRLALRYFERRQDISMFGLRQPPEQYIKRENARERSKLTRMRPIIANLLQEMDGPTCAYCGKELAGSYYEIDHIMPVARGGLTEIRNLVLACPECNRAKGDRSPFSWEQYKNCRYGGWIWESGLSEPWPWEDDADTVMARRNGSIGRVVLPLARTPCDGSSDIDEDADSFVRQRREKFTVNCDESHV